MTAQDKNNHDVDANRLESILKTVKSIDRNVEEILDTVSEHFEAQEYDPSWEHDDYLESHGYLNNHDG